MKTSNRETKQSELVRNREYNKIDFFKEWLHSFAPDLTSDQYERFIHKQYIWHIFSWELIPKDKYMSGDEARKAYNYINKNEAVIFQLWFDEVPMPITEEFDEAEKIEESDGTHVEMYVVSKDFKWTYIVTHECGFGPYFMKIK